MITFYKESTNITIPFLIKQ